VYLGWIGLAVLSSLHLDFWRQKEVVLYLGWLPEELGHRLLWMLLSWAYLVYFCACSWWRWCTCPWAGMRATAWTNVVQASIFLLFVVVADVLCGAAAATEAMRGRGRCHRSGGDFVDLRHGAPGPGAGAALGRELAPVHHDRRHTLHPGRKPGTRGGEFDWLPLGGFLPVFWALLTACLVPLLGSLATELADRSSTEYAFGAGRGQRSRVIRYGRVCCRAPSVA
jgi:hypothetical protein